MDSAARYISKFKRQDRPKTRQERLAELDSIERRTRQRGGKEDIMLAEGAGLPDGFTETQNGDLQFQGETLRLGAENEWPEMTPEQRRYARYLLAGEEATTVRPFEGSTKKEEALEPSDPTKPPTEGAFDPAELPERKEALDKVEKAKRQGESTHLRQLRTRLGKKLA